ncbi:hypothetical protein BTUL_0079g00090 [Botrytis tulipae]|uniref:Uncharacterized protein n=1 Tax=Botrytis tulipae TaxID=87230 RepID=A0A4Z1EQ04_9HELO|nr:hypothetical protein BTUL_0079g00090 [Botrytis tulipae]
MCRAVPDARIWSMAKDFRAWVLIPFMAKRIDNHSAPSVKTEHAIADSLKMCEHDYYWRAMVKVPAGRHPTRYLLPAN